MEKEYNIFGYKGKQVRDNIHSYDVVNSWKRYHTPRKGEVSILEVAGIIPYPFSRPLI